MVFFFYYIPTVGSILAIAAPAVLALVQFDHLTPFLIVLLVFGTIQIVTANVIEPTIMGRTLNLSPLVVIVSLVVWGNALGRGRHVPVRPHHGSGIDRPGAVQDHAAARRAAVGRRQDSGTPG